MINNEFSITGLFKGVAQILPNGQHSGIRKTPSDQLTFSLTHVFDDEVVDQNHHGGDMRVLHHYSELNYNKLKERFPEIAHLFVPGSFGENICTPELTESDLCIGDIFTLGTTKIQLTVPRRPCVTINATYEDDRILKEIISTGHVGWFYKIISPGTVSLKDKLKLIERPYPELLISKLFKQGYHEVPKFADIPFLKACLQTNLLDKGWKPKLENLF
ncbi:MAG: MOSC domain-containing protein [Halobacteriovoraceae bacterium]|jgi:MOSC domain-containing protein YiiM|nr:MOSC domain-containing protein [Halobacteriovoraceae bacterium]